MVQKSALTVSLFPSGSCSSFLNQTLEAAFQREEGPHDHRHYGQARSSPSGLDAAIIDGSEVSQDLIQPVEWRFDEPQPDWKPILPAEPSWEPVEPVRVDGVLRLPMTGRNRSADMAERLEGGIYVALPNWRLEDWAYVEIRARTRDPMLHIGLSFNFIEEGEQPRDPWPFYT